MLVEWNTDDCALPEPLSEDEEYVRDCLIELAPAVEGGTLTAERVEEWLFRITYLHRCKMIPPEAPSGAALARSLVRWAGLEVDTPYVCRLEWLAKINEALTDEVEQDTFRLTSSPGGKSKTFGTREVMWEPIPTHL